MATPNLYEDNKGKVTKESASGGGIKEFEVRQLFTVGPGGGGTNAVIVGADIEDLKGIFRLYIEDGDETEFNQHDACA